MGEDEPVAPVASSASSPEAEPTAEEAAEPAEKKTEEHARKRDDDNNAQPAAEPPVPAADRAASLGQAGWLAAARAKAALAGAEAAAKGRHAAALSGLDEARADTGGDTSRLSALGALQGTGTDAAALALDGASWKPALEAATVQLAPVAPAVAEAGAEFSLPSLGEAGSPAPAAPAEAPPPAQATLAPPPGSAAFPAALGAQLSTWLKDGVQYATLELNPQDMGPIDVRIALRDGQAQVELGADVAVTRQILAEALPALAEALGDVGLSLSGGSVSDQTGQQGRPDDADAQRAFGLPGWLAPAREGEADASAAGAARQPRGLVDLVA
jgi:flagellar hook-length control protein FliK